jgi:2-polyprenyl-3-methyl-5-hydroxy-6-metoxy-1,4-benzoquinol methylase
LNNYFNLRLNKSKEEDAYLKNAKADALHCYSAIVPYLKKNIKILEVGGGIHLLTHYMHDLGYDITSIEPGGFAEYIDKLRIQLIDKNKLKIFTTTLEKFQDKGKFDFIFSMNVLEHTKNIGEHIRCCIKLLKDEKSILFIQCPNYAFPFEPHFYKWFIPLLPKFTFAYLRKKKLIKVLGQEQYTNTLKHLNFNCTYFEIKKLNFNTKFIHPIRDIFDRMNQDSVFKERLLKNSIVRILYNIIIFLRIKKALTYFYPISLSPYLIMEIKK